MKPTLTLNDTATAENMLAAQKRHKQYDLLVFIGRFQPIHLGHQMVIDRARELAKNVLVIVGSAGQARSVRNPLTFEERAHLINTIYPDVIVRPISDASYNDALWVSNVQKIVKEAGDFKRIGLIGLEKDHTSYYLKLFPQWDNEAVQQAMPIHATNVRNMIYQEGRERWELDTIMADSTARWFLEEFTQTPEFERLKAEQAYLIDYKKKWGEGPFLTADALVEVGGNILLIRRGKEYGQGLYALPGGFINKYERFEDAMVRELKEETRLKVPKPVLLGSVESNDVFDRPHRSERGRIITQCYHVKLENEVKLPEVRGSDDAEWAGFKPMSDLMDGTIPESMFFEDHYHIIRSMLRI